MGPILLLVQRPPDVQMTTSVVSLPGERLCEVRSMSAFEMTVSL